MRILKWEQEESETAADPYHFNEACCEGNAQAPII
jgi:hypothetical protein